MAGDSDEAVGSRERGHAPRALAHRIGRVAGRPVLRAGRLDEGDEQELRATALGGEPAGEARADGERGARAPPREPAHEGRDELVEREDRAGRESREEDDGLAPADREAERLAGLQIHAVDDEPRRSQSGHHVGDEVSASLARASREHDDVGGGEGALEDRPDRGGVVVDALHGEGHAPRLAHGVGEDRPVRVVDEPRAKRDAGSSQLASGRDDRDAGEAHAGHHVHAARGERARLARREHGARERDRLAAYDVGAGRGHGGAGDDGPSDEHGVALEVGVLDADDRVGPARQDGPGRDRNREALAHVLRRRVPGCEAACAAHEPRGALLLRPEHVTGANGESVEVGPVERRDVAGREHVGREHAVERVDERHALGHRRARRPGRVEAPLRLLDGDDGQELRLPHGETVRCRRPGATSPARPRATAATRARSRPRRPGARTRGAGRAPCRGSRGGRPR